MLQRKKNHRERSLEEKKAQLAELLVQQIAFRNLARRNRFNATARATAGAAADDGGQGEGCAGGHDQEEMANSKVRLYVALVVFLGVSGQVYVFHRLNPAKVTHDGRCLRRLPGFGSCVRCLVLELPHLARRNEEDKEDGKLVHPDKKFDAPTVEDVENANRSEQMIVMFLVREQLIPQWCSCRHNSLTNCTRRLVDALPLSCAAGTAVYAFHRCQLKKRHLDPVRDGRESRRRVLQFQVGNVVISKVLMFKTGIHAAGDCE